MMFLGRASRAIGALITLAAVPLATGCNRQAAPQAAGAAAGGPPRVVVLKSSDIPYFDTPVTAFLNQVEAETSVFTLSSETGPAELARTIADLQPALLLTVGTPATILARDRLPEVPVLFMMVINHQRHDLSPFAQLMGVAMEPSPALEFNQYVLVAPNLRRVLTFYEPKSSAGMIDAARQELRTIGIELIAVPVTAPEEIEKAYAQNAASVEAVWMINDPVMVKRFKFLRDRTQQDRLLFTASMFEEFTQAGALMSASVDVRSVGSQAAGIAMSFLTQSRPAAAIGIQRPVGVNLVVNETTAKAVGLEIGPDVFPFISRIVVAKEIP